MLSKTRYFKEPSVYVDSVPPEEGGEEESATISFPREGGKVQDVPPPPPPMEPFSTRIWEITMSCYNDQQLVKT